MRHFRHIRTTFCLLIVALLATDAGYAGENVDSPKNVAEAIKRLTDVFGKHDPKNSRQFRVALEKDETQQPEENQPKVRDKTSGLTIYGTPYQLGEAACFDIVQNHRRTVFRLDADKEPIVIRRQERYFVARVSIRCMESAAWEFQMTFLSHSNPDAIDKTYLKGTVKWLNDGFQLDGIATDEVYIASGELIPSVQMAEVRYLRHPEYLEIKDQWQGFHWTEGPQGDKKAIPDLKRPIGNPSSWLEGKSDQSK